MKRLLLLGSAMAALMLVSAPAFAAVDQYLTVTSSQKGTKKPTTLTLSGGVTPAAGARPAATTTLDIQANDKFVVTPPKGNCTAAELAAKGSCNKNLLVAKGTAQVDSLIGLLPIDVTMWATKKVGGDLLTLRVYAAYKPLNVTITSLLVNVKKGTGGNPDIHLDVNFDPQLVAIADPIVQSMSVKTNNLMVKKGKKKKVGVITTPSKCTGGSWSFTGSYIYKGGETSTVDGSTPCK